MARTNRQITEESAKVIANNTLFDAQNAGNYIPKPLTALFQAHLP